MQPNNLFLKWLQENIQRLFKKSPRFFQIWQWITGTLAALTGLPSFLTGLGITLPPAATVLENKVVAYITIGMFFMSMFPTQGNLNSISPQNVVNKQTDPKALPFSAKVELKEALKEGKPKEVDPNASPGGNVQPQ